MRHYFRKLKKIFTNCKNNDIVVKVIARETRTKLYGALCSKLSNFAINNDIVANYNLLCFGVNFDQILLNKTFQKTYNLYTN